MTLHFHPAHTACIVRGDGSATLQLEVIEMNTKTDGLHPFQVTEKVNGLIIGGEGYQYQFFTLDGRRITRRRAFISDEVAAAWFKRLYPASLYPMYRTVEMRCYDD